MNEITNYENQPLTLNDLKSQISLIQNILKGVMKENEHYGIIPGVAKKSLWKSGAEKLMATFRLVAESNIEVISLQAEHREYRANVKFYSISGAYLGNGQGSCSTLETKYRYRTESIGEVPQQYWKSKDIALLGGEGNFVRKKDGKWMIMRQIEVANPADNYNTCMKMADKRGTISGVLKITAASDIFIQDEDMVDININEEQQHTEVKTSKPAVDMPKEKKTEKETLKTYEELSNIITNCLNLAELENEWKANLKSIKGLAIEELSNLNEQKNIKKEGFKSILTGE